MAQMQMQLQSKIQMPHATCSYSYLLPVWCQWPWIVNKGRCVYFAVCNMSYFACLFCFCFLFSFLFGISVTPTHHAHGGPPAISADWPVAFATGTLDTRDTEYGALHSPLGSCHSRSQDGGDFNSEEHACLAARKETACARGRHWWYSRSRASYHCICTTGPRRR